jgi:RHS repeat-associated protein
MDSLAIRSIRGERKFELFDHLGNVLLTTGDYGLATIINYSDYYPFGMLMPSRAQGRSRFGFNGKENDDEIAGNGNHVTFEYRQYDPRRGQWWSIDPKQKKFPEVSPYAFAINNPIVLKDDDGRDVLVAFQGGAFEGGKFIKPENAGATGEFALRAAAEAMSRGIELDAAVIGPGLTSGSGVATALKYINEKHTEGEKILIYGYSYGGDVAVELAEALKEGSKTVDLLITVDAADGPLQNITVNNEIPDNVKVNMNWYQTEPSGKSSKSGSSDSGTFDSPGSSGGKNTASDPAKTKVINTDMTSTGANHGTIPQKTLKANVDAATLMMSPGNAKKEDSPEKNKQ